MKLFTSLQEIKKLLGLAKSVFWNSTESLLNDQNPKRRTQKKYVHKLRNIIHNVHERARHHIHQTWIRMAQRYNLQREELRNKTGRYILMRLHLRNLDPLKETGSKLAMR